MQEQPKLLWKRTGQSKQVITQKPCDSVVVGGTIFLSDWAEILSVPLTSSWIYSKPTVCHCSVYSTGTWQVLPSTSEITWLQCLPVVRQMTVFKCAAFLLDRLAALGMCHSCIQYIQTILLNLCSQITAFWIWWFGLYTVNQNEVKIGIWSQILWLNNDSLLILLLFSIIWFLGYYTEKKITCRIW